MNTENQEIEFKVSWGRGIEKTCTLCKNYGILEPEYTVHLGKPIKKQGIIRRVGPDKGGHWEIIKKD